MPIVRQLTISCENRPGALARIAKVLSGGKVNIEGFVGLVVDKPVQARKALDGAGFRYAEQPVLQVELPNVPGALGRFAEKLAAKDINVTAAYLTTVKGSKKASVVLGVSDLGKATRVR